MGHHVHDVQGRQSNLYCVIISVSLRKSRGYHVPVSNSFHLVDVIVIYDAIDQATIKKINALNIKRTLSKLLPNQVQ